MRLSSYILKKVLQNVLKMMYTKALISDFGNLYHILDSWRAEWRLIHSGLKITKI